MTADEDEAIEEKCRIDENNSYDPMLCNTLWCLTHNRSLDYCKGIATGIRIGQEEQQKLLQQPEGTDCLKCGVKFIGLPCNSCHHCMSEEVREKARQDFAKEIDLFIKTNHPSCVCNEFQLLQQYLEALAKKER